MAKTATNDITGDSLTSKTPSKEYLNNYDSIFRKDQMVNTDLPPNKPMERPNEGNK